LIFKHFFAIVFEMKVNCRSDEIGIHATLKMSCSQGREGSSPSSGTIEYKKLHAYIVGLAIGDGNLSNPNGRAVRLRISCDKKYPELKEYIKQSLAIFFSNNKVSEINRKGCVDIYVYSNKLEDLLGWKAKGGSKAKQQVSIPSWILKNKIYTKECLRGLLQTDGSIYQDRGYVMVNFTSIIESLAITVHKIISDFGYAPQVRKVCRNGFTIYIVRVSKNTDKFIKEINFWKR